jgi:hypothetical protein
MAEKMWTIPGERMKAGREHRAPLSVRAVAILKEMKLDDTRKDGFVFAGRKAGTSLSNMAFLMMLRRMGRADLTAHGFRSTFRDWCAERTSYPSDVAEMALAHAVGDKVEAAYRRGDLFDKRRRLAEEWARFCSTAPKQETVAALGVKRSKVYDLINRGLLEARKIDGRTVITETSIQALVDGLPAANIKRIA